MPREQTRLIDRDIKLLVSETAQERTLFNKTQNAARKRLHWILGSIVAVFIGGWLSGSPIASMDERARTTNAGLLSSEDLFVRSTTNYLADQTERFFGTRPQPLDKPSVIELPIDLLNQASKLDDFDNPVTKNTESVFSEPVFAPLPKQTAEPDIIQHSNISLSDAYKVLTHEDHQQDLLGNSKELPTDIESIESPAIKLASKNASNETVSLVSSNSDIEHKALDLTRVTNFTLAALSNGTLTQHDANKVTEDIGLLPPAVNDAAIKPEPNRAVIVKPETLPESDVAQETKEEEWSLVNVRKGDTLGRIFQRLGFSSKRAMDIAKIKAAKKYLRIRAGDRLWFKRDEQNQNRLHTLKLLKNKAEFLLIEARNDHKVNGYKITSEPRELEIYHKHVFGRINSSLYSAGLKAGLPKSLILEMVSIYRWSIDFAKDLRPGDHFTVIYEEKFAGNEKVAIGDILAVEFVNRGNKLRAIRHQDKNGTASYFTPNGHSLRRAFLRNPLPFSRITSKFSKNRYHPILKKWRAHNGVDYGAGRGTPIMATADGRIIHKGKKGSYGNTIILQHNNKYKTLYAHMSRFAKSVKNGSRVKQGQVIGYVGSSGYATGPHLHYEFRINGAHHDPLTVKLPHSLPIENKYKADFLQLAGVWNERLSAVSNINVAKRN